MAQCKMCGHKGFFLSVNGAGLCYSCNRIVAGDFKQRFRIIKDSMKLIGESKNIDTRMSRCDLLIGHAQALLEYERKGIPTTSPSPSQLLLQYTAIRAQLVEEKNKRKAETQAKKGSKNYFEKAIEAKDEGKNPLPYLVKFHTNVLENYQSSGVVKKVKILAASNSSCLQCQALNGKVFTVQEALDTMPIPVKGCLNEYGYCRCVYSPIVE